MGKVVTIGETMVIFQSMQIGNLEDHPSLFQKVGGAESNYAIGLARLGHNVQWMSRLGNDPFGKRILKTVRAEGVDVSAAKLVPGTRTGLLFKEQKFQHATNVYYYRDQSAASQMSVMDLPPRLFDQASFFHVTGITPALSESCRTLIFTAIAQAKEKGVPIIFDPNIRFKLWTKELAFDTLNAIADEADYILAGEEEAEFLTNETDMYKMCEQLSRQQQKVVVLKRGAEPTLLYVNGTFTEVVVQPIAHILDPVGAGDAFAAGFTHGLLEGATLEESVHFGNILGGCVIQQFGDIEGLPLREEFQQLLQAEKKSDVQR